MCFGFLTYFPKQESLQTCTMFNKLDLCESRLPENGGYDKNIWKLNGCDLGEFLNPNSTHLWKLYGDVVEQCAEYNKECSKSCNESISNAKQHPCHQGDVGIFNQFLLSRVEPRYGRHFLNVMRKCGQAQAQLPGPAGSATSASLSYIGSVLLLLSMIL